MDRNPAPRASAARETDQLRDRAMALAREIAVRHPNALTLACARADPEIGPGLAAAWCDMILDGGVDLLATPLSQLATLLDIRPAETRGPMRRRLSRLVALVEELADAELSEGLAEPGDGAQRAA